MATTPPEKQVPSTPGKKSSRSPQRGGSGRGRGRGGRGRGGRGGTPNSNKKRGRGGWRGGRSKDQNDKNSPHGETKNVAMDDNFSDEDVMIEFMHLMRSGDEDAKRVFKEFGSVEGNVQQKAFAKHVRTYLVERKQKMGTNSKSNSLKDAKNGAKSDGKNNGVQSNKPQKKHGSKVKAAENKKSGSTQSQTQDKQATAAQTSSEGSNVDDSNKEEFQTILAKLSIQGKSNSPLTSANNVEKIQQRQQVAPKPSPTRTPSSSKTVPQLTPPPGLGHIKPSPTAIAASSPTKSQIIKPTNVSPTQTIQTVTSAKSEEIVEPEGSKSENPATKPKWQPKRFLTRVQEQPGKLLVNNQQASPTGFPHVILPTKTEFVATWSLPLQYLQQRTLHKLKQKREEAMKKAATSSEEEAKDAISDIKSPENLTIRDALQSLTVGLFRRGCPENGVNHSIISKQVVPSNKNDDEQDSSKNEYHFEINDRTGIIFGTVPFYSPRTPGNVVLRLYFEEDAPITLATSTCVKVIVRHDDLEQTLRFILSNFKSRKGSSGGSLSCIHSLCSVLEQLPPSHNSNQHDHHRYKNAAMDGAGRATWGCVCEARKIVDSTHNDYLRKKKKIEDQLEEIESIEEDLNIDISEKNIQDRDEISGASKDDDDNNNNNNDDNINKVESEEQKQLKELKEKKNTLMGERAVNERKWREVQTIFAAVLKAIVFNRTASDLLKHDIVMKLRLEYELWCPLCESFATNPFEIKNIRGLDENERAFSIDYPHPITAVHINQCKQSRAKMQMDVLDFVPKTDKFVNIEQKRMGNVLCANLSKAMKTLYQNEYAPSMTNIHQKSRARDLTQNAVSMCNIFPQGTRVVIFGSSANGFGSPSSDLDMCLQLPPTTPLTNFEGEEGSSAMAALAEKLVELGMKDVDQARLTARIPVIKFFCPVSINQDTTTSEPVLIECDISMQNPLAVINTSLLRNYSHLKPDIRVLVAIIKRWAKSRDINNPSDHTLSSYGFILMLLHFLTTHKVQSMSIVPFCVRSELTTNPSDRTNITGCPLLPNLQWMSPHWAFQELGTPYQEMDVQPKNQYTIMPHPSENTFLVNKYFCQLNDEVLVTNIRRHIDFHEQQEALESGGAKISDARILASFFYYYAYQFDYKKNALSLQSCFYGANEREMKSENDGWKSYGQILCIEDPFETFYDVAHVLKPGSFNKIRKEFVLAYTKIATAFQKHDGSSKKKTEEFGLRLLNSICESSEAAS